MGLDKYIQGSIELDQVDGDKLPKPGTYGINSILKKDANENKIMIGNEEDRRTWYVGYHFLDDEKSVKEKIKAKAKSAGLYFSEKFPDTLTDKISNYVWMKVMGDWI